MLLYMPENEKNKLLLGYIQRNNKLQVIIRKINYVVFAFFFIRQVVKCTNVIIRKDEKRDTQLEFMAVRNDNHERCS